MKSFKHNTETVEKLILESLTKSELQELKLNAQRELDGLCNVTEWNEDKESLEFTTIIEGDLKNKLESIYNKVKNNFTRHGLVFIATGV